MHVPDHLLDAPTAIGAGVVAVGAVAATVAIRRGDRPAAGAALTAGTAAAVFGAQMVNYPVLPGTSGHLIGAALATALVGPRLALLLMTSVVAVQALAFGDGGITALGVNVLLLAVLPVGVMAAVTWAMSRLSPRALPRTTAAVGSLLSVPVSVLLLSGLYAIGGTSPVDVLAFAGSMAGVHLVIGVGEAVITVALLSLVMAAAPGAAAIDPAERSAPAGRAALVLTWAAALFALVLSAFASAAPDGLEWVAWAYDIPEAASVFAGIPALSDYGAVAGVPVALAGAIGLAITALLGAGAAFTGRLSSRAA